ncbi:MAG: 4Fe-4S dicluster domain-containing protein [Chitinispirillaceae bacterium]|nr:4Fe-4S dicluster domain-containing protein [Chitinispirillaceae bacterium]
MNSRSFMKGVRSSIPLLPVPAAAEVVDTTESVTQLLPPGAECTVAAGSRVKRGEPLCRMPLHGSFASLSGTVRRIMPWNGGPRGRFLAVIIAREPDNGRHRLFDPVKEATALSPAQLRDQCGRAGFLFPDDQEPLLFTALDEDVDRVANRWCMEKEFGRVVSALKMLRHLCGNRKIVIALPASMPRERKKACSPFGEVFPVPDRYPDATVGLIICRHPVLKSAGRVVVIDNKRLLSLAASLATGSAATTMHVAVRIGRKGQVRLFQVLVGMSIAELLSRCNVAVSDGMQLILGGEMNGAAADGPHQPLSPETDALLVLPPRDAILSENTSCVNCGRCHRVCPVNLRVDLIGKCVEFSRPKEALRLGIERCIDCGLCTAACIVRRPLAHLLAYGKNAFPRQRSAAGGAA